MASHDSRRFRGLHESVRRAAKGFGDRLLQGDIRVEPYRHGQMTPCQYCDYASVCRIDTRTHSWRTLQPPQTPSEKEASSSDQA